ncbi:MAG: 30S ribosomal protein S11 [Candidatus Doudnabacteria bacterium]
MGQQKASTIPAEEDKAKQATTAVSAPKKKKSKIKVARGHIYVQSTYNNTIITVTDVSGNVIGWGSAGRTGFKGSKKSTPYAAQKTMEDTIARLKETGLNEVDVFVKGIGTGRESAVRALQGSGFNIISIQDQTPIPHGGVRPKKARRV